jgi:hypothetical protein
MNLIWTESGFAPVGLFVDAVHQLSAGKLSAARINAACCYLRCCAKTNNLHDHYTPGELKHLADRLIGYTTESEFVAAMLATGFAVARGQDGSWRTNLTLPKADAYDVACRVYDAAFELLLASLGDAETIRQTIIKVGNEPAHDGSFKHCELAQIVVAEDRMGWTPPRSRATSDVASEIREVLATMEAGDGQS